VDQATNTSTESLMNNGGLWLPEAAWDVAESVDGLFAFILYGSIFLFFAIAAVMLYFIIKYRRSVTNLKAQGQMTHNAVLEIAWTVIPLILCAVVFVWGYKGFLDVSTAPDDAMEVRVTGWKWAWQFDYPDGKKSLSELVVPIGQPVKLIMSSKDVLHSFYLPNFRVKRDVVPNRYTTLWFRGDRLGEFQVFCTEYCGDGHSQMLAVVRVVTPEEYQEWLTAGDKDIPLDELGQRAIKKALCNTCHSIDGSAMVGPTWKGLYGSSRQFEDGSSVTADENYLRESIENPKAKIVKGYPNVMASYKDMLSSREIDGIIEYIKTLK